MENTFWLEVMTPDKSFFQGQVLMVELTTTEGERGIYAGHSLLSAVLSPGILTIHQAGEKKKAALLSGFLVVSKDSVLITTSEVEWPGQIDKERAKRARERAQTRLLQKEESLDVIRAELALKKALTRLALERNS